MRGVVRSLSQSSPRNRASAPRPSSPFHLRRALAGFRPLGGRSNQLSRRLANLVRRCSHGSFVAKVEAQQPEVNPMSEREPTKVTNVHRYGFPALPWSRPRDALTTGTPSPATTFF